MDDLLKKALREEFVMTRRLYFNCFGKEVDNK